MLLTTPTTNEPPKLIDEDNEFMQSQDNEGRYRKIGDPIRCMRDGVNKKAISSTCSSTQEETKFYAMSNVVKMK